MSTQQSNLETACKITLQIGAVLKELFNDRVEITPELPTENKGAQITLKVTPDGSERSTLLTMQNQGEKQTKVRSKSFPLQGPFGSEVQFEV